MTFSTCKTILLVDLVFVLHPVKDFVSMPCHPSMEGIFPIEENAITIH
jgi:hypothetical protein